MSKRLYLGHIPGAAQRADVEDFFAPYGKINDVRLMAGFGFIEFDDSRDAEDAVNQANGKDFMGDRILVEFAKNPRSYDDRPPPRERSGGGMRFGPRGSGWRLTISGLPQGSSWQDLKDFARSAGQVSYADISRNDPAEGTVEYPNRDDYETALKTLGDSDINGTRVKGPPIGGGGGGGYSRSSSRRDEEPSRSSSSRYDRDDGRRAEYTRGGDSGRDRYDRPSSGRGEYERRRTDDDDRGYSSRRRSRSRSRSPRRETRERSRSPRREERSERSDRY